MCTNHSPWCSDYLPLAVESSSQPPPGGHICYIYTDEEERRLVLSQFIARGFAAGERVAYLADVPQVQDPQAFLATLGITPPALAPRQWLVTEAEKTYCPDGAFELERMLETWRALYRQSLAESFPGVRATAETTWLRPDTPGIERWLEYEARVNLAFAECPFNGVICQYDARRLEGEMLYNLLNLHPLMIVRGQLVHNPFYEPPEQYLARLLSRR